jgi:hypothetical protein
MRRETLLVRRVSSVFPEVSHLLQHEWSGYPKEDPGLFLGVM